MYFVIFAISWMAGGFIFAFTVVPILIIIFFSIPMSISLNKQGKLKSLTPIRNNIISVMILGLIFSIIIWLTKKYLPNSVLYGFLFGCATALLFSLGKLGSNTDNKSDYLETNKDYIKN